MEIGHIPKCRSGAKPAEEQVRCSTHPKKSAESSPQAARCTGQMKTHNGPCNKKKSGAALPGIDIRKQILISVMLRMSK